MTIVVGIRCIDGVVIGTDSAMTFGPSAQQLTIEQPYHSKIDVIDSHVIVAGTAKSDSDNGSHMKLKNFGRRKAFPTKAWSRLDL